MCSLEDYMQLQKEERTERDRTPPRPSTTPPIDSRAASEATSSQSKPWELAPDQRDAVLYWADVTSIIGKPPQCSAQEYQLLTAPFAGSNRLDLIRRTPATRAPYKTWCRAIVAGYGSITSYMCLKRLGWTPLPCVADTAGPVFDVGDSRPFADASNYCVERNDWPYGNFGAEITHLLVWLKVRLSVEPETGLMTGESKALAEKFVKEMFVKSLRREGPGAEARVP